jgi:dTDP-4-dehydrorhamnose 3,5-epimerase
MIFEPTPLLGAYIVDPEPRNDERGFFARAWCRREFEELGLAANFVQANLSYTRRKGTIRGLHYQLAPFGEAKLVRCLRGAIWDVMADLRPESPSYLKWFGVELNADNRRQLYIPEGCAHGYQTLAPDSEVLYQVSAFYTPDAERGIRWSDPRVGIRWPETDHAVSAKDDAWPDFEPDGSPAANRENVVRVSP